MQFGGYQIVYDEVGDSSENSKVESQGDQRIEAGTIVTTYGNNDQRRELMVKAELDYNPYLNTSLIRFNGKKPHINSLVEKYQNSRLEDWISRLPDIFRDEMNGYGFELSFSGTSLDFEELCEAFNSKGLSEHDVALNQYKTLGSRESKVAEVQELLRWLDANRNRTFDFNQFRNNDTDVFDSQYSIKLLHGNIIDSQATEVLHASVENIDNVVEFSNIDLTDTPIIFFIDHRSLIMLQDDLKALLKRNDVNQQQLFFWISASISTSKVRRVITDLGISNPVIISSFSDKNLHKYCLLYPVTDYITKSIKIFRMIVDELHVREDASREKNEKANLEIYQQIDLLENSINLLTNARESLKSKDIFETPISWATPRQNLYGKIYSWRAKKIKTTNKEDAFEAAQDLNMKLHAFFDDFITEFHEAEGQTEAQLKNEYHLLYQSGNDDLDFSPVVPEVEFDAANDVPTINSDLLDMKAENYVSPKEDLFGRFFKGTNTGDPELVLETTYSFQEWREYALSIIQPLAEKIINDQMEKEKIYFADLRDQYIGHLSSMIQTLTDNKERVSMQLTDDEKKFQEDVAWLSEFSNRLNTIERGYENE